MFEGVVTEWGVGPEGGLGAQQEVVVCASGTQG